MWPKKFKEFLGGEKIQKQTIATKIKFFIPLLLINLTLLFCLTTVSAADNDTMYVATNGSDSNDGFSWDTPKLTIKNATGTLNTNGTIHIAKGEYKGENNTGITIDKNMTIIGESQTGTIINGTGSRWIFHIEYLNINVIIQNLTVTNGTGVSKYSSFGGAILNNGTLTVENCIFTDNNVGAIWNFGNLTVKNCTFTDNTAEYGSAICNTWDGACNVKDCTFTGNTATNSGGAISQGGNGIFTITGCNFINNNARYYAGAIADGNRDLIVENCTFTNNTADEGGAIIAWAGSNLDIFGCSFIGNMANKNGGAINFNCPVNINYCTFINNTANGNGGSIYIWTHKITKINFNRFYNNTAIAGEAIYSADNSDLIDAENNWWGSNNPVWGSLIYGLNPPEKWVILTVIAAPTMINNGETSTITADLNHINGGGDLTGGHVPDGPITLDIPWGSFTSSGTNHSITLNTIDGVIAFTFHANEGAINPLFNPVMITATADGYTTNDTESAYITINPAADISVNKTFEDTNHNHITNANYQDTIIIHLNVTNNGPDTADWVVIEDIFPLELDDSSFGVISNSPYWGYIYYSSSRRLTVYIANITNGTSYDVWINVTNVGHNNNLITNTAQLNTTETYPYDPNSENNNSTDSYTANASADVSITKEFRNLPWGDVITNAYYNDRVYAIVRVSNLGPDSTSLSVLDSLTGITWTGTYYVLPYLIPNIQENWIVNDTTNTFNGTHWNIPLLGSGLGGTVKWLAIEGIINRTGPVSNYAETVNQSAYPYAGYDSYTAYLTANNIPTNLTINNARGNKNETVTLKAALKDHQGNPLIDKTVEFWIDGVKVGENTTDINGTATFNYIIAQTPGNHTLEAVFNGNTEYLASSVTGQLYVPKSDLYIKITSSNNNPKLGQTFTITYKLGNNGPDEAKNVTITIPLPEGFKYTDISGDGNWTYNASTNTITWTLTNVPVGDPYLYISGYVNNPGTYVFGSSISSETYNINTEGVNPITINTVAEVKAASKTIPLQNTGLPITGLILAILAVFSGLATSKRK